MDFMYTSACDINSEILSTQTYHWVSGDERLVCVGSAPGDAQRRGDTLPPLSLPRMHAPITSGRLGGGASIPNTWRQ